MNQLMDQTTRKTRRDDVTARRDVTDTKARMTMITTELCRRCGFHPVSPRVGGYCSWDCHDADDDADDDEGGDEGGGERAA